MKKSLLSLSFLLSLSAFAQDITTNLEAYFPFNNGQVTATDGEVTQVMHVVFNMGAAATADRHGNANSAMIFNGTSSYIDFGDLANYRFGMSGFTVALWMAGSSGQAGQGIPIGKRGFDGADDRAYMFGWKADGELLTYYRDDAGVGSNWPLATVAANAWTHIAMVFSRVSNPAEDSVLVYINGALAVKASLNGYGGFDATGPTQGGQLVAGRSSQGGQYFMGKVDELYVFRRALTALDIAELSSPSSTIGEGQELPAVTLYPNPAANVLKIEFAQPSTAEIYSMDGHMIETLPVAQSHVVDLSSYAAGMYLVRCENQVVKFIKE